MAKSGMTYEGVLRSRIVDKNGKRNDLISYSITKDEYFNNWSDGFIWKENQNYIY